MMVFSIWHVAILLLPIVLIVTLILIMNRRRS
jgi:hypothetical protein